MAVSSWADAYTVSQGKADIEYNAFDEAFPGRGNSFALHLASLGLPPLGSRYWCWCRLMMHC